MHSPYRLLTRSAWPLVAAHQFAPRLVACPLRLILPATPLLPLSCSISTFRNFRPLIPPGPLVPCQLFHIHSFRRFFAGERVGCVVRHFLAGPFSFADFLLRFAPGQLANAPVLRPFDWPMRPFRVRSIGPCVRFAFTRLANAPVSRSLDWPIHSFCPHSIGQCTRFAFIRLVHTRSPVGGDFRHRSGVGRVRAFDA